MNDISMRSELTYYAPHLSAKIIEIQRWCLDNRLRFTKMGATWVFGSDEDRIKFVMRWA